MASASLLAACSSDAATAPLVGMPGVGAPSGGTGSAVAGSGPGTAAAGVSSSGGTSAVGGSGTAIGGSGTPLGGTGTAVGGTGSAGEGTLTPPGGGGEYTAPAGPVDFGPNVLIFDPGMGDATIQAKLNQIFAIQEKNQFGAERYAYFFKPGEYNLDVRVGFYTEVCGLGASPDDVSIAGAVRTTAEWFQGNATQNFWRLAENMAVAPSATINPNDVWAVSQATALRRMHIQGGMNLFDPQGGPNEWASGGFIADSKIDGTMVPGSQQQFLTRNVTMNEWVGGVWNMVFVGNKGNPSGAWPTLPYTFVDSTPSIREKPYLIVDAAGKYSVVAPTVTKNTVGASWVSQPTPAVTVPIEKFYVAHSDRDSSTTINAALKAGANLLLTPGVYHLDAALEVTRPGTIMLGLGMATLIPDKGTAAIKVADVDSVTLAGILLDAGALESPTLLQIGDAVTATRHALSPTALFDVSCRVGGVTAGLATTCVIINSNDVFIDNAWLWRADHGAGVDWDVNKAKHGLIVNGNDVTAYGLFVEHFEEYQTMWNGEGGKIYFYQSEIPYDVPSQDRWMNGSVKGFSSLKLADGVKTFDALGLGIYCFFYFPVFLENAIEAPQGPGIKFEHIVTQWFKNSEGSGINHIMDGAGSAVTSTNAGATL